ncbi:MAG: cation-translocating P-type ATPase [Chitinophagales bacterium]
MASITENNTKSIKVDGMTCINCAINVENAVKKAGIQNAHVNFASKELIYEDEQKISLAAIELAIKGAGYSILKENTKSSWLQNLLITFSFLVAAYFILAMFLKHGTLPLEIDLVLAALSLGIAFYKFGKGAFYSLKSGSANMYVLILLGATTAFCFSIYLILSGQGQHLYFETTAVLVALVLIGDIIEEKAIQKTISAFSSLAEKKVSKAKRLKEGQLEEVSINALKVGDKVQANLGDEIHAEGKVIEGTALLSEAIISGEALPIQKEIGASVIAGSQVIEGNLVYEVRKSPLFSTKAMIHKLVQEASGKKADVQKLADRISAIFVPLIIAVAVLSFLINYFGFNTGLEQALIRSVAILVISCPCAMGLATPIAIFVGLGKMTKHGILIKNANVFENFAEIDQIIFDKTGTLTTGKFKIANYQSYKLDDAQTKAIILALESRSSHPIASSIIEELKNIKAAPLRNIVEEMGKGMQGHDEANNLYQFGSASYTQQDTIMADLFLCKNGELIASLDLEDTLKSGVKESMDYFQKKKIAPLVLSGDKKEKCKQLAANLEVEVIGELRPEDKLAKIESLATGSKAMLGDGVNDAPSLSLVNVGISFVDASNLAVESSDVILMNPDFASVKRAHQIAQQVYQTIQQNLFWAFAYNLIAIPLAAFGYINPMLAAFFMIFSDLVVVGNAFYLKIREIEK